MRSGLITTRIGVPSLIQLQAPACRLCDSQYSMCGAVFRVICSWIAKDDGCMAVPQRCMHGCDDPSLHDHVAAETLNHIMNPGIS